MGGKHIFYSPPSLKSVREAKGQISRIPEEIIHDFCDIILVSKWKNEVSMGFFNIFLSDKFFKGSVVNPTLPSLHVGSLEITLTTRFPLNISS